MRKASKTPDSEILSEDLIYGHTGDNKRIAEILFHEQKGFCAYTDEYISRTDAKDIEHFNPQLKNTDADNYYNWFLVKHQWNKEKSYKWDKYQPILHPTSDDFEERVTYLAGDYSVQSDADIHASNLISLLKLDDVGLAEKRKKYIARKRKEIEETYSDAKEFFFTLIEDDICQISYLRAIREEFGLDLWSLL